MKKFPTKRSRRELDFAHLTNIGLKLMLPVLCLALVLSSLTVIAYSLVLVSKWRVLAVKSRYWVLNLRANMVDVIVSISIVSFMSYNSDSLQNLLIWFGVFVYWIVSLRNSSTYWGILSQAVLALGLGVSAIAYSDTLVPLWQLVVGSWFIGYFSARHVLSISEEHSSAILASIWAIFAGQLAWVLGHWQIWFSVIHQLVFVLVVLGLALSLLYTHDKDYGLKPEFIRLVSASTIIIMLSVLLLSDWQDKTI